MTRPIFLVMVLVMEGSVFSMLLILPDLAVRFINKPHANKQERTIPLRWRPKAPADHFIWNLVEILSMCKTSVLEPCGNFIIVQNFAVKKAF